MKLQSKMFLLFALMIGTFMTVSAVAFSPPWEQEATKNEEKIYIELNSAQFDAGYQTTVNPLTHSNYIADVSCAQVTIVMINDETSYQAILNPQTDTGGLAGNKLDDTGYNRITKGALNKHSDFGTSCGGIGVRSSF